MQRDFARQVNAVDMETLCREIQLPEAVFRRVTEFLQNCDWKGLEPSVEAMTDPDMAERAYQNLRERLGDGDMGMLACQLSAAVRTYARYRDMGIPDSIYYATMACFSRFLKETKAMTGVWQYDRAFWSYRQTSMVIYRIGELEYELCREPKRISVHIPSDAKFTPEHVDTSLMEAKLFLKRFHPEYQDVPYLCDSWLLSPELGKLLPETSNILQFQRRFRIQAVEVQGREFIQWLFAAGGDVPVETLPEDTSLRRSVKALLLRGGNIGAARGILKELPNS